MIYRHRTGKFLGWRSDAPVRWVVVGGSGTLRWQFSLIMSAFFSSCSAGMVGGARLQAGNFPQIYEHCPDMSYRFRKCPGNLPNNNRQFLTGSWKCPGNLPIISF